jgi:hypothetical protein
MKRISNYLGVFLLVGSFGLSYWLLNSFSIFLSQVSITETAKVSNPAPRCTECLQNKRAEQCLQICVTEFMYSDFFVIKANSQIYSSN